MRELFGILGVIAVTVGLLIVGVLGAGLVIKPFFKGIESSQGVVLSVEQNLFTDCVEISKTTQGESVKREYCVYYKIDLPKVGEKISVEYTKSALLFKDSIKIEVVK